MNIFTKPRTFLGLELTWSRWWWRSLLIRPLSLSLDNEVFEVATTWTPLFDLTIDFVYRKNYYTAGGFYIYFSFLGWRLETMARDGEKEDFQEDGYDWDKHMEEVNVE